MNKIIRTHRIQQQIQGKVKNENIIKETQKSFYEVLDAINRQQELKFSKHAIQRLESRNIHLNHNEITRINNALGKASQKGIKETLILMDNKAFVASVKNKTIITAAVDEQLKDNVFTNIDGAVII
jgi:flagellar operon protein